MSLSLPRKLALPTLVDLLIVFLTKVNLLYLLYLIALACCLLHLIKQNCLLSTFPRPLILMTQLSLYLLSRLEKPCFSSLWFFSDFEYDLSSFQSTAELLRVVLNRIAKGFNRLHADLL